MKLKGYTLWLLPTGEEYNRFANIIRKLAREYHGPLFQPHITLLSKIMLPETEVIRRTEQLMSGQKPVTVKLGEIDYQDFYFRTLFVKADKTKPLVSLHNFAKKIFQMSNTPPYMPHLSLLYGNFPQEVKEKIIKEIGKNQTSQFEINSVHLVKGENIENQRIIREFPLQVSSTSKV